jgi:hypothetical protein
MGKPINYKKDIEYGQDTHENLPGRLLHQPAF